MKTYITSDLHFSHANIKKFCPKTRARYPDVIQMDQMMIQEWNEQVAPEDIVYILGDIAFCGAEQAVAIMQRLNGKKILIEGNHDIKLLKDNSFRGCFIEIHQYLRLAYNGQLIIMFHYPIFDHDQAARGSIMLHGHRHGNPHNIPGRIMDVGMDSTGKIVMDLDEIVQKMQTIQHMYTER